MVYNWLMLLVIFIPHLLVAEPVPSPTPTDLVSGDCPSDILFNTTCSREGHSCDRVLSRNNQKLIRTFVCMRCSHGDPNKTYLDWHNTDVLRVVTGTLCGSKVEVEREDSQTVIDTPHLGQCREVSGSRTLTVKSSISETTISCSGTSTPTTTLPSTTAAQGSGVSTTTQTSTTTTTAKSAGTSNFKLPCMILTKVWDGKWESGYTVAPDGSWGIPPGGVDTYSGYKITSETVDESTSCPAPYRRKGSGECEAHDDPNKSLGISCP